MDAASRWTQRATARSSGCRDDARFVGDHDELRAVACTELGEDPADVRLGRRHTHVERLGQLRVREPARDQREDLALAFGERVELSWRARWRDPVREAGDEPPRDTRREQRLAGSDDPNGAEQLLERPALQCEPARAGSKRFEDVLIEVERREDEHARRLRRLERRDLPGCLDSVHYRHPHVHHHNVRREAARLFHRLAPVDSFADDLQVVLGVDERGERRAEQRLLVGQQAACALGAPWSGTRPSTRNPPPGRNSVVSDPPKAPRRSRMPMIPWRPPGESAPGNDTVDRPSSVTSTRPESAESSTRTVERAPGACFTTFVSASWTTR